MVNEKVVVVDYGGQYTHLIARRCRELGVYAEITPQDHVLELDSSPIKGVILSGGPRTADESDLGHPFATNLETLTNANIPVLGICFGHQLLAIACGAELAVGGNPEYGSTPISIISRDSILRGLSDGQRVWMSHSDQVISVPDSVEILATSRDGHVAAFVDNDNKRYGVQFHPEVFHTANGNSVLRSFLRNVCGFKEEWAPEDVIGDVIKEIRELVSDGKVLMGTSGGVDSTVAAVLIKEAIGDRLYCVFVDNGLLRDGEAEEVRELFLKMDFKHFEVVDAKEEFLTNLDGIENPEEKRRVIADTFIRVFERKAKELESEHGRFDFLGQGTIYPDRVESAATGKATSVIKSHHNVRLPDWMKLRLVEPLRDLYKDEVRQVGLNLGIPKHMIQRQPFPGPSLAIRIGGPVNEEQLSILRHADRILQEELRKEPFYQSIWQSFCVLLPVRSVGVMGDERTYDQAIAIRIVESQDAMTASVSTPPWEKLLDIAARIANEVKGINRVVYDLTSKPPGTIEWY